MKKLLSKLDIGFHRELSYNKPKLYKQELRLANPEQTHQLGHKCMWEKKC